MLCNVLLPGSYQYEYTRHEYRKRIPVRRSFINTGTGRPVAKEIQRSYSPHQSTDERLKRLVIQEAAVVTAVELSRYPADVKY